MGVGTNQHGTLDHRKLKIGRDALASGEKPRPYYLASLVELAPRTHDQPLTREGDQERSS